MSIFENDKSSERLPVSLITGFLGSGKTTLLNRVLRHDAMKDSAVVINDHRDGRFGRRRRGDLGQLHDLVGERVGQVDPHHRPQLAAIDR